MNKVCTWHCDFIACITNTVFHASEHVYKASFFLSKSYKNKHLVSPKWQQTQPRAGATYRSGHQTICGTVSYFQFL